MQIAEYTLKLTLPAVQLIADHLKKGVYNDVANVLNEIAGQVARQEQAAEQAALQSQVSEAAASLPAMTVVEAPPAAETQAAA